MHTTSLSQILAQDVPPGSRSRGQSYFASGAVRSLTFEHGVIEATVRGAIDYTIWIERDRARLTASCTCPYFLDRSEICKHIWAVVLAAEAQSVALVPEGIRAEQVELEPRYPADFDVEDPFGGEPPSKWQWGAVATPQPQPARRPAPPPPWRQLIDGVSPPTAPPTLRPRLVSGQLLYVVDAAASTVSGSLVVELMTRDRKINGEWGKPKPARIMPVDVRSHADAIERQILERLLGARPHLEWTGWDGGYGSDLSRFQIRGVLVPEIVPRVCAIGSCLLRVSSESESRRPGTTSLPIAWDDGPPWVFTVAIRTGTEAGAADPASAGYVVEGWLARGDERMELTDPLLVLADGILFTQTHAAALVAGAAFSWLAALRSIGPVAVPAEARDQLIDALLAASPHLAAAPADLQVETVQGQPRPQLRLRPMTHRVDRIRADVSFDYEGTIVQPVSPHRVLRSAGSTRAILRDTGAEQLALDALHRLGCRQEWSQETGDRVLQLASSAMPRVVRQLLNDGWLVEAKGQAFRRPGAARTDVRSGIDWFELHGHVEYDEQRASLPALLAAVTRGESFVMLDDGSIGLLPEEWLRRYTPLARLGSASGDHLRFKRSQVALLDALLGALPETSWDATFANARAELQSFDGIRPADPPAAFVGTLRSYQRDALGWLIFLQRLGFGGCLADDMGLGKTVMVLALLAARRDSSTDDDRRPSLVVAPRSVVFNWRQEALRFTPHLRVLEYGGVGRAAMRETFSDHDVVLTTYGTLRRDATELSAVPFDYVVLDEAQAIKNAASVSAKTTRILNARHRLALSGTPVENHLGELWSLFEFLNPGLLNSAAAFDRAGAANHMDDEAIALLARGLRPFLLRRTKEQVASDLPPKTEQTLFCELERPQRALYDELLAHYRGTLLGMSTAGLGRAKLQVLEALLRLRQAACHPGLVDRRRTGDASAKLDVLVPRLLEAIEEGHKTIVFSQFTSLLAILRVHLDKAGVTYEYLDGRTRDRQSIVERFQGDPACRLFLVSLKAGGLGLNLTAAEYVFLLDPWWNPAVEAQAIDRAHRIGQARHVFAYRLIARDTVEERVLELQQRKRKLADAILSADGSLIRDLRREDLELLLS